MVTKQPMRPKLNSLQTSKGPSINYVVSGGRGALCVEMGFTWTFPRNQDATVKLEYELISIKV